MEMLWCFGRQNLCLVLGPMALLFSSWGLAKDFRVGGDLGIGIVGEAFRNGIVTSEMNVGISTAPERQWSGSLEVRKKPKDTKLEASQVFLSRLNQGGSVLSLGLIRKNMGVEASRIYSFPTPTSSSGEGIKDKWPTLVMSPAYEKLESLGYVNTEPRVAYKSEEGNAEISLGFPQSTNINLLVTSIQKADSQLFYGYEFRQDLLIQTEKLVSERLLGGALTISALGYHSEEKSASNSVSLEVITGLDSARTAFLREIGNNRKSYFASVGSTFSTVFFEEESYFWRFYSRLSRFSPDVKERQKRVDEIALGLEFIEGPVRLSSAVHWQLQSSGSTKGSYNTEGSQVLVRANYHL